MLSCGVVVEYNPFHNGHAFHLKESRRLSGAEAVIAVMSGNWLQRGEPAIIDKWARTRAALANGADLVVELPFASAVQAADYFAKGAIEILHALHCDALCFGTDSSDSFDYADFGRFTQADAAAIQKEFQVYRNNGMKYPEQMRLVYEKLYPPFRQNKLGPNHLLALSYAKENAKYQQPMTLFPLKRIGSGYHEKKIAASFASATAIREALFEGKRAAIREKVPAETFQSLMKENLASWEDFWPYLRYVLLSQSPGQMQQIYQMVEGVEHRLITQGKTALHFADFCEKIKTKRYSQARLMRLCCYLLNQVSHTEIKQAWREPYLRILGFNATGRAYLNEYKKKSALEIVTQPKKENRRLLALAQKTDAVYYLGTAQTAAADVPRYPIFERNSK